MGLLVELVYCLCGELMKKEEMIKNRQIPVCWKCQCDSLEDMQRKKKQKRKNV